MCLMTFEELCGKNLGAADYIALAGAFHTLSLLGVPIFDSGSRPEAYRFVTLVDVLYENRIRLFCSAAGSPHALFANVLSQQEAKATQVRIQSLPHAPANLIATIPYHQHWLYLQASGSFKSPGQSLQGTCTEI